MGIMFLGNPYGNSITVNEHCPSNVCSRFQCDKFTCGRVIGAVLL